jgi:Glycosyl transferase family 2
MEPCCRSRARHSDRLRSRCLCNANRFRASKFQQAIQRKGSNLRFGHSARIRARPQRVPDHSFVTADIRKQNADDAAQASTGLQAAVRVAYVANLRRPASRTDIAHYTQLLRSGRRSVGDLCDEMRSSPEYLEREQLRQLGIEDSRLERSLSEPVGKQKAAVFTTVFNEKRNLPIWLRYYGSVFGQENLFVLDDGSDDGSTDALRCNKVRLPRTSYDEMKRTSFVMHFQRFLLASYEWAIFADADELLVPDPLKYQNLLEFLDAQEMDAIAAVGLNLIHRLGTEPALDWDKGILTQRSWAYFISDECKTLISRIPLCWTPGFHESDAKLAINPDLYLFHTKFVDLDASLAKLAVTRQLRTPLIPILHRTSRRRPVALSAFRRTDRREGVGDALACWG